MGSIVFLIKAIWRNQFRCKYLRNKKLFLNFFLHFSNLVENLNIFKKKVSLVAEVFPKLRSPKNMVTSMSKNSSYKASFAKQHGKRTQRLLKFAWQHLYHIYLSLWRQLTCKKSLLVICKISRLFPNTLSADGKYPLVNRENLMQPIQMQGSRKQKNFLIFFCIFGMWFKFLKIF